MTEKDRGLQFRSEGHIDMVCVPRRRGRVYVIFHPNIDGEPDFLLKLRSRFRSVLSMCIEIINMVLMDR